MCVDPFNAITSEATFVSLGNVSTTRPLSEVVPALGWDETEAMGRSSSSDDRTEAAEDGRVETMDIAPKERVRSGEVMVMRGLPGAVEGDTGSWCWKDSGSS